MTEPRPGAPVEIVNATGPSDIVLLCEHATNWMPEAYAGLGLPAAELQRHIAWDPGAAAVARRLSALLDAPLFLSGCSRLVIDCNRPPGSATSIPDISEATRIPGNAGMTAAERQRREDDWFWPYHNAIAAHLDGRAAAGRTTILLGIHSFTPVFLGVARPWQCGMLYKQGKALGQAMIAALRQDAALTVGDNEPYRIEGGYDWTVPVHGDGRGIPCALVELRQDLIATEAQQSAWAERLAAAIRSAV